MQDNKEKLSDKVTIYTPKGVSAEPVVEALKGKNTTVNIANRSRKTNNQRNAGSIVKGHNSGFANNISNNLNKNLASTIAWSAVGSLGYVLVPTILQKVISTDLTGWKGFLLGLGAVTTIGLGCNKPEIAVGALAAGGTHLLYSKGTKAVLDITGVPLYTMANSADTETQAKLADSAEVLPYGAHWTEHKGKKVAAFGMLPRRVALPPAKVEPQALESPGTYESETFANNYENKALNDFSAIENKRTPNSKSF